MSKITDHPNWSYRGYIPHFDAEHKIQMITYRLADSFPQSYYKELENNLNTEKDISLQKRAFIESILDKGYGECYLRQVDFATVVRDAWLFFDKKRFDTIHKIFIILLFIGSLLLNLNAFIYITLSYNKMVLCDH